MKIVRTIVWVLLLVALLIFSVFNWSPVEVKIWENLVIETKIPALVIIAFLIGLVPMWLLHRATKWQLHRRIGSLENAARAAAMAPLPVARHAAEPLPEEPRTDLSTADESKPPAP
ncbi:MAG TPA: hypothetical protein VEB68_04220 [Croceibacterium sp.]|nr:hypothetical protein [Croceibacterium sp.]